MFKTIHHQACTGGTLISKTITAMHKVRLLSEVNPNGPFTGAIQFEPTNLISQYCKRFGRNSEEFRFKYFSNQLELILDDCEKSNIHLVLRDHCHNEYMSSELHINRKPLIEAIKFHCSLKAKTEPLIKSVVTVRHPLDSFLSCLKKGWVDKINRSLETYSERYIRFLEDYADLLVIKYEDFCEMPETQLKLIAAELDFPYDDTFIERFYKERLTGDSGRTSDIIKLPERREIPNEIKELAKTSEAYFRLCKRLDYDPVCF